MLGDARWLARQVGEHGHLPRMAHQHPLAGPKALLEGIRGLERKLEGLRPQD